MPRFPLWVEAGNEAGLAEAHSMVAIFEYYNARRRQAEDHLDRAAEIASEAGSPITFGHARTTRAYLAVLRSEVELAPRLPVASDSGERRGEPGVPRHVDPGRRGSERPGLRRRRVQVPARRPCGVRSRPRLRRAGVDRLLPRRQPRRRARPLPPGRAAAGGGPPVRPRARHPDLLPLPDRRAHPVAVRQGPLERRSRGRSVSARRRGDAARDAVAPPGLGTGAAAQG